MSTRKPQTAPNALPPYRLAPVDSLVAHPRNARMHSDAQIAKLVKLITEYGFTNPMLVNARRGILAGHGRWRAARQLGMTQVPTIELAHLTPEQEEAYVIADNRSALDAGWDDEILRLSFGMLRDAGFDLGLTGFDGHELDALFADDDAAGAGSGAGSGAGRLAAQFGVPPFTVLNAREGWWQARKAAWLALGIQSEVGRGEDGRSSTNPGNDADGTLVIDQYRGKATQNSTLARRANATPGGRADASR